MFDTALGLYDFGLVELIAQYSQKVGLRLCPICIYLHSVCAHFHVQDPREYLPFIRNLQSLEPFYQRFKIDEHLKRYESGLKNLAKAGELDDHV